MVARLVLGD